MLLGQFETSTMQTPTYSTREVKPIPVNAGIGLRAPHYLMLIESRPPIHWLEVHSENLFGDGGPLLHDLERIREYYPLSLHGVGLSLGSADELNRQHLDRLKELVDRFEPGLVSEHLSWSSVSGRYLHDLLPLPYTEEALLHVVQRILRVQDWLGCRILVENVSSYLQYACSTMPEWEFLREVAEQADCKILLDVNNIYVNSCNHGFDPLDYLQAMPRARVAEIHLAGHSVKNLGDTELHLDTHDRPVSREVWTLYEEALQRLGPLPTLIEWDTHLPPIEVLMAEAQRAEAILEAYRAVAA